MNAKWKCSERHCGWHGDDSEMLRAPNPFDEGFIICACPKCKEVGVLSGGCDEPGCTDFASCGTPTPDGYRVTCGKHAPIRMPPTGTASSGA